MGMQQEIGLRLRDIDAYYERCTKAIEDENERNRQLAEAIQSLMNETSIKLPPSIQKQIGMEDQVKQLALDYSISLQKGKDMINPAKATAVGAGKVKRLGEAESTITPSPAKNSTPAKASEQAQISVSKADSMKYIYGGLAVAAGLALGCVVFSK
jgi:hypothetical protein